MIMGVIPVIVLAGLIVFLGVRLLILSRQRIEPATIDDFSLAQHILDSLVFGSTLTNRIFAIDDCAFVARVASPGVQALFEKERKTVAVKWIRKTQRDMARLMEIHLRLASHTYNPSPRYEFAFGVKYLVFTLASYLALFLVYVEGPHDTARAFAYTVNAVDRLCLAFRFRLDRVNPAGLRSLPRQGE